jgi:iron complex outermembrane receptor protein
MNSLPLRASRCPFLLSLFVALSLTPATFAQVTPPTDPTSDANLGEIVVLSPFEVNTQQDRGYRATNSISGSRLDTPIKDIPMPIEVITDEFIQDVGARNLRESLRYSAGIVLRSQNDAGQGNTFVNAGGVHSSEGATAAKSQTTVKLRGFITDTVLRNGFRRQHATDSANIGRIEVVRGPAALLYGIGNFGGIVNYLPKQPTTVNQDEVIIGVGTHGYARGAFDTNRYFADRGGLGVRISGAAQTTGDFTELYKAGSYFVAPVVTFRPAEFTKVTIDLEYGEEFKSGTGFQSVRARADVPADQQDRLERAGFVDFPGKNRRTFRWSGPDTYLDTKAYNVLFSVEQRLTDNLHLLAGINTSMARFKGLDVGGALQVGVGPASQRGSVVVAPLTPADNSFSAGTVNNATWQYNWTDFREKNNREQVRAELSYRFETLSQHRWLAMNHNFLLGRSEERAHKQLRTDRTTPGTSNYKNPQDTSYIRFGTQGDGSPDAPMTRISDVDNIAWNQGSYAVYQGRWIDNRVTLVGGMRNDRNDNRIFTRDALNPAASSQIVRDPQSKRTGQYGVSVEILPSLSVFGLRSEGLVPNFEGLRDGYGNPIDATIARSQEYGIKVDLIDGRLSGTISRFKIERTGTPYFYWWAPAPAKKQFDPTRPITYLVEGANPEPGQADWSAAQLNALAEWNAAKAAGAAYQQDGRWYLNASNPAGAAYMDKVYANVAAGQGWPGWFFDIQDPNVNIATMDRAAPDRGTYMAYTSGDDESKGWDLQLLWVPNNNFQLLTTFSRLDRRTVNVGKFPRYPYPEDRWANWYFPDGSWGLSGFPLNEAYRDPTDTSTWTGAGYLGRGSDDDSPKHAASFWATYSFDRGAFKGLAFGFGGQWESKREFVSARTDGSGQLQVDENGDPLALYTDPRLNLDAMARYHFQWRERPVRVQININNVLNDRAQYGLGFAPGISARIEMGMTF